MGEPPSKEGTRALLGDLADSSKCPKPQLPRRVGFSVAFCSPAKSLTFSGLVENPLVGKKLKSQAAKQNAPKDWWFRGWFTFVSPCLATTIPPVTKHPPKNQNRTAGKRLPPLWGGGKQRSGSVTTPSVNISGSLVIKKQHEPHTHGLPCCCRTPGCSLAPSLKANVDDPTSFPPRASCTHLGPHSRWCNGG